MFLGTNRHSIDAKGRLIIPARDRYLLGDGGVLTRGLDTCLTLYTRGAFQKIYHNLLEESLTDPETRDLNRAMFSRAVHVELDSAGRINIPAPLRAYAGLNNDVVLVGNGIYLEVWDAEAWVEKEAKMDELNANPARFANKAIAFGKATSA